MMQCLRHRGPDDSGVYEDGKITLGHQRLSIIDLSEKGHQPMRSADGRYTIVYNGEIYNYIELRQQLKDCGHIFSSESDTEVILNAYLEWGKDCLNRLNGMWSFVIWDSVSQGFFCARDRFGIKPLFYWQENGLFVFSSEIKALLASRLVRAMPNYQAVYDFIIYGKVNHSAEGWFKGIYQLPPAHYGEYDGTELKLHRYWDIDPARRCEETLAQAAQRFYDTFVDAVRLRFRSDVEVASCLSGGLDSSSIVCVADYLIRTGQIHNDHRLNTFSLVFDEPQLDERKWIQLVKDATQTTGHYTAPSEEDLLDDIDDLIDAQEEPFGSTSIYGQFKVMKLIQENGIKVSLDGQGADELLAGYLSYADAYFADIYLQNDREKLTREISSFCRRHRLTPSIALERAQRLAATGGHNRHVGVNSKYFVPEFAKQYHHELTLPKRFPSFLKNQLYQDLTVTSIPALLRYEDRNSMHYSIESRVPFLDYRLAELVFSLPDEMIVKDGITKVLLREAMSKVLPPAIANRQDKIGFATPESIWFRNGLRPLLESILCGDEMTKRDIFDCRAIQNEWAEFASGRRTDSFIIWRIAATELWFRRFIDDINASRAQ
jgi:asparagine synthase (glutamine-hydrolysing)